MKNKETKESYKKNNLFSRCPAGFPECKIICKCKLNVKEAPEEREERKAMWMAIAISKGADPQEAEDRFEEVNK